MWVCFDSLPKPSGEFMLIAGFRQPDQIWEVWQRQIPNLFSEAIRPRRKVFPKALQAILVPITAQPRA